MQFFLGTHKPNWLWKDHIPIQLFPLFVSHMTLRRIKTLHPARGPWALDSGGFTQISTFGTWTFSPWEYVCAVRRYMSGIGKLQFAAIMDWMCEPIILEKTGKTIRQHQELTLESYLTLTDLAPEVPWLPTLQGFSLADYFAHKQMYERAGVNLVSAAHVGIGSVCRRQSTKEIGDVLRALYNAGLRNIHGFGVKTSGLKLTHRYLKTSDSMAWSYNARKHPPLPEHEGKHNNCANCWEWALRYKQNLLRKLGVMQCQIKTPTQGHLLFC